MCAGWLIENGSAGLRNLFPSDGQTQQPPNLHAAAVIKDAVCGVSLLKQKCQLRMILLRVRQRECAAQLGTAQISCASSEFRQPAKILLPEDSSYT